MRWGGAGALAFALAAAGPGWTQPSSPAALLAETKAASGGARWDAARTLGAVGEKTRFGLTGSYSSVEDLRDGRFTRRSDYGLFASAEGLDAAGRWRMDSSGGVHPLDSDEARAVAATEAWLAARGYLFPDRTRVALERLDPVTEDGETFDRVAATPDGGRAATLWIGRTDHRIDRALIELENRTETIGYRDYRRVGGLALPFEIVTENGAELEMGEARIARYSLDGPGAAEALRRPAAAPRDAAIRDGSAVASAPFGLDALSGFPIVEASVNGRGPLLFVLDTGGHDFLTAAAAQALGLPLSGSGFSLGAGAGSTPTRFTKVATLALGAAELTGQPFAVLELDLGPATGPDGRPAPIAGVIGLELFERFTVTLDYAARRLSLSLPGTEPIPGGAPIRFSADMPLARASLDGREGWFALDTGNTGHVILFKAWVEASGLPDWFEVSVDAPGAGVGGAVAFRQGRAGGLSLAGVSRPALPVLLAGDHMGSLSSRGAAGHIGESVLSHYVVIFDYAHEKVRLDAPSTP